MCHIPGEDGRIPPLFISFICSTVVLQNFCYRFFLFFCKFNVCGSYRHLASLYLSFHMQGVFLMCSFCPSLPPSLSSTHSNITVVLSLLL